MPLIRGDAGGRYWVRTSDLFRVRARLYAHASPSLPVLSARKSGGDHPTSPRLAGRMAVSACTTRIEAGRHLSASRERRYVSSRRGRGLPEGDVGTRKYGESQCGESWTSWLRQSIRSDHGTSRDRSSGNGCYELVLDVPRMWLLVSTLRMPGKLIQSRSYRRRESERTLAYNP